MRSQNSLEQTLQGSLASLLGTSPAAIDRMASFQQLGLSSLLATRWAEQLSIQLQQPISPLVFWEYPSVAALACWLLQPQSAQRIPQRADSQEPVSAPSIDPAEPIAIIGLACRLPGASQPSDLFQFLRSGVCPSADIPASRWPGDDYYSPALDAPGRAISRRAALIADRLVTDFDAAFFGISPREAPEVDPQQRLMLELAWEALEDAGVAPTLREGLQAGSRSGPDARCGVFIGCMWADYAHRTVGQLRSMSSFRATGTAPNMLANRVSYALGLRGPSLVVDTACSSSLTALHLACDSLRHRDCTLSLVGGVNLILSPNTQVALSKFGGLSPDGRSKAFAASADGYGRGEGAVMLLLKPLSQALADGNPVHATILASAVNSDGASNGLTAPSPQAQRDLLAMAYTRSGLSASQVHYVEAHGTGTALGDPIEAGALGRVLGQAAGRTQPLFIGSVKTHIGHLEAAAGAAGVLATVLAMRHRELPASLHFDVPNPHIPFADLGLRVVEQNQPWPAPGHVPPVAGVSSFGWGGSNAHVVLQGQAAAPQLVPIAACSRADLRRQLQALHAALATSSLPAVANAACEAIESGAERIAILPRTRDELLAALDCALSNRPHPRLLTGTPGPPPRWVFICSPHGAQWAGMGQRVLEQEPAFREAFAACDTAFTKLGGPSLWTALRSTPAQLARVEVAQPLQFALQIALAAQLRAWGCHADAVLGHCMGEISAAYLAGILDLPSAAHAVLRFSHAQARVAGQGGMLVASIPVGEAEAMIAAGSLPLAIAGENGLRSTLIAGPLSALAQLRAALAQQEKTCAWVAIDVPVHSPQMADSAARLATELAELRPQFAQIPMLSTVTCEWLQGPELTGTYLATNLCSRVRLAAAVQTALQQGPTTFIELSAHPLLTRAIADDLGEAGANARVWPSLQRPTAPPSAPATATQEEAWATLADDHEALLRLRGRLFVAGSTAAEALRPAHALPFVISAQDRAALCDRANGLASFVTSPNGQEHSLSDIAFTASQCQAPLDERRLVWAQSRAELAQVLRSAAARESAARTPGTAQSVRSPAVAPSARRWLFVFSGQGSQWAGMGTTLYSDRHPLTAPGRALLERCEPLVQELAGFSLREALCADANQSRLAHTSVAQPALLALSMALCACLRAVGVQPTAVLGHSVGEIAAAHLAGALDMESALRLAVLRGRLMESARGRGGRMLWAALPASDAPAVLAELGGDWADRVTLAAENGPRSLVFSGDGRAIADLESRLAARAVVTRSLRVEYAFHSPHTRELGGVLAAQWQPGLPVATLPEACAFYSSVTGTALSPRSLDAAYWGRNLSDPVRFAPAALAAMADGYAAAIEIGPHPVLLHELGDLRAVSEAHSGTPAQEPLLASLRRDQPALICLQELLSALYQSGQPIPLLTLFSPLPEARAGRVVPLPPYPWQRRRFFLDADALTADRHGAQMQPVVLSRADKSPPQIRIQLPPTAGPRGLPELLEAVEVALDRRISQVGSAHLLPGVDCPDQIEVHVLGSDAEASLSVEITSVAGTSQPIARLQGVQVGPPTAHAAAHAIPLADWSYELAWLPYALPQLSAATSAAGWRGRPVHILTDGWQREDALRSQLVRRLQALGTLVHTHEADQAEHTLPLAWPPQSGQPSSQSSLVLYLPSADVAVAGAQASEIDPAHAAQQHCLRLRQAVLALPRDRAARLFVVTRGAQLVHGRGTTLAQAPLWGLGRVLAIEHPMSWGGLLDLDPQREDEVPAPAAHSPQVEHSSAPRSEARSDAVELLLAWLLSSDHENQLAERDGALFKARLQRVAMPPPQPSAALVSASPRPNATYLISGGLGGIGLCLAADLVERGARQLLLLSRRQPTADQQAKVQRLRDQGASVQVAAVAVEDTAALASLLAQQTQPLAGVLHCAGVCEWVAVDDPRAPQAIEAAFAGKAQGAWHLHQITASLKLDFFVLFGSGVGVWGSRGQAAYAAANQFLGALAHARRRSGLPALCVDWGLWQDGGIGDAEQRRYLAAIGLRGMASRPALAALWQLQAHDVTQRLVANLDTASFRSVYESTPGLRLLTDLPPSPAAGALSYAPSAGSAEAPAASATFLATLRDPSLSLADRQDRLGTRICEHLALLLAHEDPASVPRSRGFVQLGLSSLLSAQLMQRLGADLEQPLPTLLTFEYPTVNALTEHLLDRLHLRIAATETPPADVDDWSEDAVAAQLAQRLSRRP